MDNVKIFSKNEPKWSNRLMIDTKYRYDLGVGIEYF